MYEDLFKRLKRHAHTASSLGSLATHFMLHSSDTSRAEALQHALGSLKGPMMKVAQLLSTIPDMLPQEYVEALSTLQSQAPPMGWLFVKRRLKIELGPHWETLFESFEKEASAAASLGQVHKATSKEGQPLAVKIQYPDMDSVVQADISHLKIALALYEKSQKTIHTEDILEEIKVYLNQELDYKREAQSMEAFGEFFSNHPIIQVPKPIPLLSTQRVISMTWLEGLPLSHFEDASEETRNHLATALFRAWYSPLYQAGILHGDPHLGNYTASSDGAYLNLLDFGCIRVFEADFVVGILTLYEALQHNNLKKAAEAYELWGFKNLSFELIEILNLWASYLYAPLLDNSVRFIHPDLNTQYGQNIAKVIHEKLKSAGGLKPPRTFVLMDRAAVGLGAVFLRLRARLNWHLLFCELTQEFSRSNLSNKQNILLKKNKLEGEKLSL